MCRISNRHPITTAHKNIIQNYTSQTNIKKEVPRGEPLFYLLNNPFKLLQLNDSTTVESVRRNLIYTTY